MNITNGYHKGVIRGKQLMRAEVVRRVFGGQTALAHLLGVDQSMVNHLIFLRRTSERLERQITDLVRSADPKLVKLWALPELPKGASRATLMRIAAVIAGIALFI